MRFKLEKLDVWQRAMDYGEAINNMVRKFPSIERYNLSSQLLRAVDSIALNISEGAIGQSDPEQKRFLSYSVRSTAEVVTCLHKAKRRAYLTDIEFETQYNEAFSIMNMIVALMKKLT